MPNPSTLRLISRAVTGQRPLPLSWSQASHCVISPPQQVASSPYSTSTSCSTSLSLSLLHHNQTGYLSQLTTGVYTNTAHPNIRFDNRTSLSRVHRNYTVSHATQSKPTTNTQPPTSPSQSKSPHPTMSSDDAYTFFLERANADPSSGTQPSSKKHNPSSFHTTKTIDDDQHVPQVLADVEIYYISDTDEAFDPVVLDWPAAGEGEGRWPSTGPSHTLHSSLPFIPLNQKY